MIKYSRKPVITEAFILHRRAEGGSAGGPGGRGGLCGGPLGDNQATVTFPSALLFAVVPLRRESAFTSQEE